MTTKTLDPHNCISWKNIYGYEIKNNHYYAGHSSHLAFPLRLRHLRPPPPPLTRLPLVTLPLPPPPPLSLPHLLLLLLLTLSGLQGRARYTSNHTNSLTHSRQRSLSSSPVAGGRLFSSVHGTRFSFKHFKNFESFKYLISVLFRSFFPCRCHHPHVCFK